jgi:hypothetical protein
MRSKQIISKTPSAPPRITRSRANFVPIAEIVEQDGAPTDNAGTDEKVTKKSDENEEGEDDDDDDDASTHNAKCASIPTCDWEGEKCYCLGIRPSMCRRSGCKKFAHQYCQISPIDRRQ